MWSDLKKAINSINVSADWIGIRAVKETSSNNFFRDGLPQSNGKHSTVGAMLEVLVNGCLGYGATNSLELESLQAAADAAYKQALAASEWWIHPFEKMSERPGVVGEYISPSVEKLKGLNPGEVNDLLVRVCKTLKVDEKIVQTTASATITDKETWFVSSNGSEIYQKFLLFTTHFGATAQDGLMVQQRTNNGWSAHCYQGVFDLRGEGLWYRVQQIGEQAVELLTAEECPNTRTNLVLAPDQMMLQIHESVGHPLEIDRILGDERNYAGGSFVKTDDFGQLGYGSPAMNITFDPTVKGEFASYGFDDTGAVATREYVIKEGVLQRGLGSLESQARSGVNGVACARACSWNRPAIDRMANLNLEPGDSSFAEI
ncbi:MAG: TldD/PmbA family protein, partial [Cyanobacteria bacterium J06628_3]